jgi:short-subunit dehydrogenase
MTTAVILGATSGIAQATARRWAARGWNLRLVARDSEQTQRLAADLTVRGAGSIESHVADLGSADRVGDAVRWAFDAGSVDVALVAFGTMPSQEQADASYDVAADLLTLNGAMCLLTAHAVALRLLEQRSGSLAVIGSVAGDRGRASNYLYGAAKAMVATGVAGLQHRAAGTPVAITLVKPGPTATPMTDHLRGGRMRLAKAETVADDIVRAVDRGTPVVYTPRPWQLIMTVIRLLPRRVFERTRL